MIAAEENNMFAFLFTNLHPTLIAIKLIFPSQLSKLQILREKSERFFVSHKDGP